jgi:hypothetical protein
MKNISVFIKDDLVKRNINKLFESNICIDTIEKSIDTAINISYGNSNCTNIVFSTSAIKDRFLTKLKSIQPDLNVINCNCTIDSFFENDFNGFLVFNNLKRCQYMEIIEEIKKHKAILLC